MPCHRMHSSASPSGYTNKQQAALTQGQQAAHATKPFLAHTHASYHKRTRTNAGDIRRSKDTWNYAVLKNIYTCCCVCARRPNGFVHRGGAGMRLAIQRLSHTTIQTTRNISFARSHSLPHGLLPNCCLGDDNDFFKPRYVCTTSHRQHDGREDGGVPRGRSSHASFPRGASGSSRPWA